MCEKIIAHHIEIYSHLDLSTTNVDAFECKSLGKLLPRKRWEKTTIESWYKSLLSMWMSKNYIVWPVKNKNTLLSSVGCVVKSLG